MIPVEEYLERVLELATLLPADDVPIDEGVGRVLAEDLPARFAVPPFDNSAMDGFAVRAADLSGGCTLRVVGDIPAGASSAPTVGQGECARIMTGAPLPPEADAVVPVESTDQPMGDVPPPDVVMVRETVAEGRYVRRRGDDVAEGDVVLRAGTRWTAEAAGAASSLGYATVPLRRRPRVAVLATGDELVAPGAELGFGQIPDSNSYLLAGLVERFGGEVLLRRAVGDDPAVFRAALDEALEADVVVTTGGVSVGAFEVVRQVTEGEISFVKVNMQPGKPQASGMLHGPGGREVAFLGLPGNPVSAWVSAWMFLRPLLAAFTGHDAAWPAVELPVREQWRKGSNRRQYIPVRLVDGGVAPSHALGSGSHLIASLHLADGLAMVPEDQAAPGETVLVQLTR